ncbi:hypothetical protein QE377_003053 [Microbacterium sp. SORGH_AS 862]|nr:hypothetical protein [Microbacterium sp. SORGH_AS_0862]
MTISGMTGVHLARHDARPRLQGGQGDLAEPRAGPRRQQAQVVARLRELHGDALEHARQVDERAWILRGLDEIRRGRERPTRQLSEVPHGQRAVAGRCVQAGADRRRAEVHLEQQSRRLAKSLPILVEHDRERAELLPEGHRHRILQLRPPDLHETGEICGLRGEGVVQDAHRRIQSVDALDERDVDRRRVGVVGRLAQVDMVVRVQVRVLALGVTEDLQGPVGDDLVRVHVGRRARSALDDVDDELVRERAASDLAAGSRDGVGAHRIEQAEVAVGEGCSLLHEREPAQEERIRADRHTGHREVVPGAGRVDTPVGVVGDLGGSEEVVLDAGRRHVALFLEVDERRQPIRQI